MARQRISVTTRACGLQGQRPLEHICPACCGSTWSSHHTNCSSEPSSHLGIWKLPSEILLSRFPIVPLEWQTTHRSGKALLISVADTATWQMGRYCELHAIPQVLTHCCPTMTIKMVLIHYAIPRPLHGRHNLICVSHPNTGGQWDQRKSVRWGK